MPSVVLLKSLNLLLHRSTPVWNAKCCLKMSWFSRRIGFSMSNTGRKPCDGTIRALERLEDATLAARMRAKCDRRRRCRRSRRSRRANVEEWRGRHTSGRVHGLCRGGVHRRYWAWGGRRRQAGRGRQHCTSSRTMRGCSLTRCMCMGHARSLTRCTCMGHTCTGSRLTQCMCMGHARTGSRAR